VPEAFHARFPVSVVLKSDRRSFFRHSAEEESAAVDEAPRRMRTREKTSGTQGSDGERNQKNSHFRKMLNST